MGTGPFFPKKQGTRRRRVHTPSMRPRLDRPCIRARLQPRRTGPFFPRNKERGAAAFKPHRCATVRQALYQGTALAAPKPAHSFFEKSRTRRSRVRSRSRRAAAARALQLPFAQLTSHDPPRQSPTGFVSGHGFPGSPANDLYSLGWLESGRTGPFLPKKQRTRRSRV
jgi:hypothetical protein